MDYDYVITLKRQSYKAINIISQLLLLIFLIAFARFGLDLGFSRIKFQWLVPICVIGLWVYTAIRSREKDFVPYYRLCLLMSAFGWVFITSNGFWLAVVYCILGLTERFIKFPDEIGFSKDKVVRNTFPRKSYEWVDIDNAIIRDNLFTLDLRNNKLLQKELDEPVDKELELEFNAFCKDQLHFSLIEDQKEGTDIADDKT
ncbi:MAG: hypothetical protein ABIX01_13510 [Chitinophagaceae bacterium]